MRIVILDGYTLNPDDLSWRNFQSLGDCVIYERTLPEQTFIRLKGAEIAITNKVVLSKEIIEQLPDLKYIGVLATGYNIVDVEAARKKGIVVTNIPAYSTDSVAQLVFAHIFNIANRVGYYSEQVSAGRWANSKDFSFWDTPLIELTGQTIGIVGYGNIGQKVARIALALEMNVLVSTSKQQTSLPDGVKKASMDVLFKNSDIVSLHCPLNDETAEMINATTLKMMKPSAILINTGRGGLVNEQDLADALNAQTIFAAGIDVLSTEPPKPSNPLLTAKNCYISPHIGWATKAARERLMDIAVDNLKAFIENRPQNCV
ncbi:D-2-hydroxyacid dehydrogenase [Bacteroidales bacterium OttesenSCG-928-I14]|nr:D-2-hydroxyacid dehydrogenase [Bacteroidales bacterium OttesenSCG-928-I14]